MKITDLFNIPKQCIFDIYIPTDKIFNSLQCDIAKEVESIVLHACLKPSLANVVVSSYDNRVYDEIHVYIVNINTTNNLYDVAKEIYRAIKYPCIAIFELKNKCTIGLCPFSIGKLLRHVVGVGCLVVDGSDLNAPFRIFQAQCRVAEQDVAHAVVGPL